MLALRGGARERGGGAALAVREVPWRVPCGGDGPGAQRVNRSTADGCSSTSGTASRPSGIA
jgi:hypothetical protein